MLTKKKCNSCGLCIQNCPFTAWEMDKDEYPRMKEEYECFSCFNCMAACSKDAISIVETYHVDDGFWATDPLPLPIQMPLEPRDADGNPDEWNPIERAIFERRSVRNYKDKPVQESLIQRVIEAGRFAPSAGNCQPWKFVIITNKKLLKEINETIYASVSGLFAMYKDDEMVKNLAGMTVGNPNIGMFDPRVIIGGLGAISRGHLPPLLNAPAVIIIAGDTRAIGSPEMNIGICGQNMNLVANSIGIKCCWVGFIAVIELSSDLKEKLGLEPPWRIMTSFCLGYPKFKQEGIVPREKRPVAWFREGSDSIEIED